MAVALHWVILTITAFQVLDSHALCSQVAATTLHHKALQLSRPHPSNSSDEAHEARAAGLSPMHLPGSEGQLPAALAHSAAQGRVPAALPSLAGSSRSAHGSDTTSAIAAAELVLKREDAELSHRAASERQGLPSNVEGFK